MAYGINRDEHIVILGIMVRGRPNSLVKKSWVGSLHMFTHIPTHPLFSKYLVRPRKGFVAEKGITLTFQFHERSLPHASWDSTYLNGFLSSLCA